MLLIRYIAYLEFCDDGKVQETIESLMDLCVKLIDENEYTAVIRIIHTTMGKSTAAFLNLIPPSSGT